MYAGYHREKRDIIVCEMKKYSVKSVKKRSRRAIFGGKIRLFAKNSRYLQSIQKKPTYSPFKNKSL